jgi:hypothetical protein
MTIKQAPCVTLACNGCGAHLEGDGFVQHFADAHEALAAADEQEWTGDAQTGDAWCRKCQVDDEVGV